MNKFIFSILQLSFLSITCLGYLLFSSLEKLSHFKGFIGILLGTMLITPILIYSKGHRKSILIGYACLILIHMSIRWNSRTSIMTDDSLKSILENSTEINFNIEKRIDKNIYKGSISSEGKTYSIMVESDEYVHKNSEKICDKKSITKKLFSDSERPKDSEDYSFILKIENCKNRREIHFRKKFRESIYELLCKGGLLTGSVNVGMGLIFGDTGYLDDNFKTASREGGIIHLFAASGLHLGIFLGSLSFILVKIFKLNFYLEKIIPIIIGFGYLYLLNFPVSLSRAYLFAFFWMLGKIIFRNINTLNLLILCSTIISLIQFDAFLEVSFLLSFGAVLGIFYLKKPFDNLLFNNNSNYFTDLITISIGAGLGTFPILIYFFHSYSFGSIFLNFFLIPICAILLPTLYLSLLVQFIELPIVNELFWTLTDLLLRLSTRITLDTPDSMRFYRKYLDSEYPVYFFYLFFIIIILLIYFIKKKYFSQKKNENIILELNKSRWINSFLKIKLILFENLYFILFSILCFISTYLFYHTSYRYNYPIKKLEKLEPILRYGSFLIQEDKNIYIDGNCFYFNKKVKINLSENYCEKNYMIHMNDSSCIKYFIHCKELPDIYFYKKENHSLPEIFRSFPEIQKSNSELPRSFESAGIHFYSPHKESLEKLKQITQKKPGLIYLQFPYKSRDSSDDWNKNKKYLGIDEKWEFKTLSISPDSR